MPKISHATSTDSLVETFRHPDDFDGMVLEAILAPHETSPGKKAKGEWKNDFSPWNLGVNIHYKPDDDDDFWTVVAASNFGGLEYFISCTEGCDDAAQSSDIAYPGDPIHPHGLNLDLMDEAGQAIWYHKDVAEDVGKYHAELRRRWGGREFFGIGNKPRLYTDTNYNFWLEQAEKLAEWKKVVFGRWGKQGAPSPNALLQGLRGHFVRVEVPRQSKKSAMSDDKFRPFKLLVMATFDGYVNVDEVSDDTDDDTSTNTPGDARARFTDAIVDVLVSDDSITTADILKISMDKAKWTKDDRKIIMRLRKNDEFLESVANDNGAAWENGVMSV